MTHDYKNNIKKQSTWKRGLYMLMFGFFYQVAEVVLFMAVVFQFLLKLITGDINQRLKKLSQSIAAYIYQVVQFLSFNSEYHPYPFGDWPDSETDLNKQGSSDKTDVDDALKKIEQDVDVDGD